ncbi:hypothetical protein TWF481_010203 [Arthrobotrys musiformis]|uniref:Uncharacterized protein n=1 Tax=Arthrobotrys musiformis TaxID=47236 RepID=A0AAV9W1Y5_9PEZI
MRKSRVLVYSALQLLFLFIQAPAQTLAVPCYTGTAVTTTSDATSSEQCGVIGTTSTPSASSMASKPSEKPTTLHSVTKPPTAVAITPPSSKEIAKPPPPPPKIRRIKPPTSPNNQTVFNHRGINGRGISTGDWTIECESAQEIYENHTPHTHIPGVTPEHWPDWADYSHEDAITWIQYEQGKCESCYCDEDGLMQFHAEGSTSFHRHCPDMDTVNICISLYGCSCHLTIEEDPEDDFVDPTKVDDMDFITRVTTKDISEHMDSKKDLVLYGAFNRWWKNQVKKKSPLVNDPKEVQITRGRYSHSSERYWVGTEKEPYYLEGLSQGLDEDFIEKIVNYRAGGLAGFVGLAGGKGFWKRDESETLGGADGADKNGSKEEKEEEERKEDEGDESPERGDR